MFVKKIVVIGPESTGKSCLCAQLAAHYQTQWVPEFARNFLLAHGKAYTQEDLYTIAMGQLAAEDAAVESVQASKATTDHSIAQPAHTSDKPFYPLFIDTDMYVMKVWSEIVFHQCNNRILNAIAQRSYDLYLLCHTDLPWVADELREYPDLEVRQTIFQHYKDAMLNQPVPFTIISGNTEERFTKALEAIEQLR